MEPQIQYAKTSDGVNIAFWTLGQGTPFVFMPPLPWSHIQLEWQIPEYRHFYERLAAKRLLIRYDGRGSGLSDRDVNDFSIDAHVRDLNAVVDRLRLERFDLWAIVHDGPIAIVYATRHPARLSHLVLWCAYARASDYTQSTQVRASRSLIDQDWELYTETAAHAFLGWPEGEPARRIAAMLRQCITPQAAQACYAAFDQSDVTDLLQQLNLPALVLNRREGPYSAEIGKRLAAGIPGARLALFDGSSLAPFLGDADAVASTIDEFLDDGESQATGFTGDVAPSLHTILFTDIEGSSALRQRLGDAKAQELVRAHNAIVREALKSRDGTEIKHTGDGIMASFGSAVRALESAVAIQRGVADYVQAHPDALLAVYVGLNAGEPIAEEEDLFGTSVDLARRICDEAGPGQILASDVVRQLAAGKGFSFSDRGEVALRGFEDPVRLYEVRWREEG